MDPEKLFDGTTGSARLHDLPQVVTATGPESEQFCEISFRLRNSCFVLLGVLIASVVCESFAGLCVESRAFTCHRALTRFTFTSKHSSGPSPLAGGHKRSTRIFDVRAERAHEDPRMNDDSLSLAGTISVAGVPPYFFVCDQHVEILILGSSVSMLKPRSSEPFLQTALLSRLYFGSSLSSFPFASTGPADMESTLFEARARYSSSH